MNKPAFGLTILIKKEMEINMFSRKVIGAIQVLCILNNSDNKKLLAAVVRKECTVDNIIFRQAVQALTKNHLIERNLSSPIFLTLKVPLESISLFDLVQACHIDIVIGESYMLLDDSTYYYRYLSSWNELTRAENELKNTFIEHLRNIKVAQLKPVGICPL